jgi:hypothetical protein
MIGKSAEPSEGSAVRLSSANTLTSRSGPQLKSINADRSLLSMRGDSAAPVLARTKAPAPAASLRPGPKGYRGFPLFNALIDGDAVLGVLAIVTHGFHQLKTDVLTSSPHGPPRSKSLHWQW